MDPQPAAQRRQQQREVARRAILDAAEAVIVESGYTGLSIRRLAARCGYTAPTIYHHFGDKNGLVDTLLNARFEEIVAEMRKVPRSGDPARYLRTMARTFVRVMLENRTHYHLTFATPRLETTAELLPAAEEARGLVDDALQQLAARGQLATTDLEAAFQSIWVILHGFIDLQIARPDYAWSPELLELMLDTWERGMVRARET